MELEADDKLVWKVSKWASTDACTHALTDGQPQKYCLAPTIGSAKKVKVAHTRLPSVEFRSWSQFLAVSLQVTWVINPTVGCRYFPPGLQLPPQHLRGLLLILLLGEEAQWVWAVCLRLLPDSIATGIWTRTFCARVQHANHSPTEPPIGWAEEQKCL